jgi:hypothetical protein
MMRYMTKKNENEFIPGKNNTKSGQTGKSRSSGKPGGSVGSNNKAEKFKDTPQHEKSYNDGQTLHREGYEY